MWMWHWVRQSVGMVGVVWWLDWMIVVVFSNLNDSMILWLSGCMQQPCVGDLPPFLTPSQDSPSFLDRRISDTCYGDHELDSSLRRTGLGDTHNRAHFSCCSSVSSCLLLLIQVFISPLKDPWNHKTYLAVPGLGQLVTHVPPGSQGWSMTGEQDKGTDMGLFPWPHLRQSTSRQCLLAFGCYQEEKLGNEGVALVNVHPLISTFEMLCFCFSKCSTSYVLFSPWRHWISLSVRCSKTCHVGTWTI